MKTKMGTISRGGLGEYICFVAHASINTGLADHLISLPTKPISGAIWSPLRMAGRDQPTADWIISLWIKKLAKMWRIWLIWWSRTLPNPPAVVNRARQSIISAQFSNKSTISLDFLICYANLTFCFVPHFSSCKYRLVEYRRFDWH